MTTPDIPNWHVDPAGIHEETELPEHGTGLRLVHVVPYVIDSGPARGHHGTVRVTGDDFTADMVGEAIDADVLAHHLVANLSRSDAGLA